MARLILALLLLASTARAATITGRVVEGGFRVAEYGVYLDDPDAATLVQDGDGRFTLRGVSAGHHRITFVGWAFERRSIEIDVTAANLDLGTVTVEPGRRLSGRVVDAAGALVDGATVIVYEARPTDLDATPLALMAEGVQLATSRHDGTYTVYGLPADPSSLRVLAYGDDMVSSEHLLGTHTWSAELAIGGVGTLVGRVTNPRRMTSPIVLVRPAGFEGKPMIAGVDPAGHFQLALPAGVYDVRLAEEVSAPLQVVIVAARTRAVTLAAPAARFALAIEAAECTYVRLLGARPGSRTPRTEIDFAPCDDNRVQFGGLPPGPYKICVDTEDEAACELVQLRASATIKVSPGSARSPHPSRSSPRETSDPPPRRAR